MTAEALAWSKTQSDLLLSMSAMDSSLDQYLQAMEAADDDVAAIFTAQLDRGRFSDALGDIVDMLDSTVSIHALTALQGVCEEIGRRSSSKKPEADYYIKKIDTKLAAIRTVDAEKVSALKQYDELALEAGKADDIDVLDKIEGVSELIASRFFKAALGCLQDVLDPELMAKQVHERALEPRARQLRKILSLKRCALNQQRLDGIQQHGSTQTRGPAVGFDEADALAVPDVQATWSGVDSGRISTTRDFVVWMRTGATPRELNCQEGVFYSLALLGKISRGAVAEALGTGDHFVAWTEQHFAKNWVALHLFRGDIPVGAVIVLGASSSGHIALHLGGGQFFSQWSMHDGSLVSLVDLVMLANSPDLMGRVMVGTGGFIQSLI
jgi:hypothetical protein